MPTLFSLLGHCIKFKRTLSSLGNFFFQPAHVFKGFNAVDYVLAACTGMHKTFGIVTMDFVLCETLLVKCLYAYKTVIINKLAKVWPATVTMHYENMPI